MGVCPTSPHVLCGSGEGIRPCPSWYSVGSAPHEYGVRGPLLRAVRSLYDLEQELGSHCRQRSQGPEGVRFGNHRISSLLFADDVVLLASSSQDLQHVLERFAAECEAAGMRISTSKSEAMVLDRKRVVCPLRVSGEVLPQVEEFKYLGVLFTSEGKMEREIDRRIGAASMQLCGWLGAPLRDRVRSSVIREELGVEPLLLRIERSQLRWLGHLFRMPPGRLPREVFQARVPPGGGLGKTQDTLERLCLSDWPGNASGSPRKSWRKCL
ncbi:hypothetical protein L3Q82_014268, partial [Scortum barcoo]